MDDGRSLVDLTGSLQNGHVLCVGDAMLDCYVHGEVSRISPEAPIPVLRTVRRDELPGGAANVARNVCALGAAVTFVSAVGDDAQGDALSRLLEGEPRLRRILVTAPGRRTTVKTRFVAGSQQILRVDEETLAALPADLGDAIVTAAVGALAECDTVILSDYGKGVLTPAVIDGIVTAARHAGKPVLIDPKGGDFARYRGASLLTPNLGELREAARMAAEDDDGIVAAARALVGGCGVDSVLVTRSEKGMTLLDADGAASHLPAAAREVFDVSGAGDTVIATLAAARAVGASTRDAARLANVAAGIVVGKAGTAVARPREIVEVLLSRQLAGAEAKVVPLESALDRVALWRRTGSRIAFTNGCFDLLHPGHVHLLDQAAATADRLVVGLNSDDSVARLKGPGRPVQHAAARSVVLASLQSVDLVVVFEEETPMRLIEALRPDVLVKGADYSLSEVVGADAVTAYGGRVMLAELADGHSTTQTIARLTGTR